VGRGNCNEKKSWKLLLAKKEIFKFNYKFLIQKYQYNKKRRSYRTDKVIS